MVTIAHLVSKLVEQQPFLEEALARGLLNYVAVAQQVQPEVERALRKKVRTSAIAMALRRQAERLIGRSRQSGVRFRDADVNITSDLFEMTVLKAATLSAALRKVYDIADVSRGDFLALTHGTHEVTIIANKRHQGRIAQLLEGGQIEKTITDLAALSLKLPRDAVDTPGYFYTVTKALAWQGINVVEIVSTLHEMILILQENDIPRAFQTLKQLIKQEQ